MSDLFGHVDPATPFQDIRNTRPSAAQEKANLCAELNRLCRTPPRSLNSASIQTIRGWRQTHKDALRVLQSPRSSIPQLRSAITSLQQYE
jgi:hypothetical protein